MKSASSIVLFLTTVGLFLTGCALYNPPPPHVSTPSGTLGIVQMANQDCTAVNCTTPSFSFTNPVKAGNAIAVVFWFNHAPGATANSVTDSNNDIFTNVQTVDQGSNNTIFVYIAKNVYGGATQVSINIPAGSESATAALELSGAYGDVDASQSQTIFPFYGGNCTSGNVTTAHADVLLGFTLNDISYSTPITYGTSFTGQFETYYFAVETEVVTTTGSYQATFSTGPSPTQQPYYIATTGVVAIY